MTIQLFAQPYDISAAGFFFECLEEYEAGASKLRSRSGAPVEEFEIQFIEGEAIDAQLFNAAHICQGDIGRFFEVVEEWEMDQKIRAILVLSDNFADFDFGADDPRDLDIDFYEAESLRELAEQFVEEGLYGEVPEQLQYYLDYDAIGRDLRHDGYVEAEVAGFRLIYRAA